LLSQINKGATDMQISIKWKKRILAAGVTGFLLGLLIVSISIDWHDDLEVRNRHYCQMVAINKINPDLGWPHHNKSIDCE
jgi:hypothetical protein